MVKILWADRNWMDLINHLHMVDRWATVDCCRLDWEYIGKIYNESKRRPKYIVDLDLFNPLDLKKREQLDNERNSIEKLSKTH